VNSNGAVLTLATLGYGNDAAKIVRSMFDGTVTIAYLRQHPELVDDYIDFFAIRRWQYYEFTLQEDADTGKDLSADKVTQMKKEYEAVHPRFQNKNGDILGSWCKVSIPKRAEDVGLGKFYPMFYAQASGMQHLDMAGLMVQTSDGIFEVEVAPSERYVKESLAMAFNLTFRALHDFNQDAALGLDNQLAAVKDFYIAGRSSGSTPTIV
jgi:hypothetical protein